MSAIASLLARVGAIARMTEEKRGRSVASDFLAASIELNEAICAVTDEPMDGLPLLQFDTGDSYLIENIVKWIRGIFLEEL